MNEKPVVIAVCGKGGVGKTSISALLVRLLSGDPSKRILAIDADPAVGLSFPLGITVRKTVDDVRTDLIARLDNKENIDRASLIEFLDYELFSAIEEKDNLAFLAIGRPEGDGCYCQVNGLLKDIIKEIAGNFDIVIIDAEAGVEQISRRVMEMVTHLLLVSDVSMKGRNVAKTIHRVAKEKCSFENHGLIFNRMHQHDETEALFIDADMNIAGVILENDMIRSFDREGKSFFEMPDCAALDALGGAVNALLNGRPGLSYNRVSA